MQPVDILIDAGWIIPVEPANTVLEDSSIAVHHGRIVEILPTADATEKYVANTHHQMTGHLLTAGFVNTHTHAAMSLMRGLADDLPLMDWLENHIWPAENTLMSEDFVRDGCELAIAEMLRSGTTCFNDMYFYPDITARVARDAGIRAVVGLIVLDFPSVWAANATEYIDKGLQLNDQLRGEELIRTAFAPHAPYTVSDQPLEQIQTLVNELDIPVHMHLHETEHEIAQSVEQFGVRPIERLNRLGLLGPNLVAVHMTQLQPAEIELLAENGVHIVHCPQSNLKLASGFCAVDSLQQAGVNIALGTDGAASNNDLDMGNEMQTAALLAKAVSGNAGSLPAAKALEMATLNGARALGMDHLIGSLLPGKSADIIAIDMNTIETRPLYHLDSQLVYSSSRDNITDVWINGQHLLNQRELTTLDNKAILTRTNNWQQKIRES